MKRGGFFLIELLGILPIMAVVGILTVQLYTIMLGDVPRRHQLIGAHGRVLDMLRQIQYDIDSGVGLLQTAQSLQASEKLLLIGQPNRIVAYQIQKDKVVRHVVSPKHSDLQTETTWETPNAQLRFEFVLHDNNPIAVIVHKAMNYEKQGLIQQKLVNKHVFAVDTLPIRREAR